ncbi:MAG: right-handed parallel beta-helix repeat-containing protein [Methanosarcina sp.]
MNEKHLRYIRQNRKKIGVSIVILIFLIALGVFILYAIQSDYSLIPLNKTVYVTGDGSGNFTCDGSDDQVEINQALAYVAENPQYSTVHLKGSNTYVISDSILIGSNTVLEGDSTAIIKLKDKAGWPVGKPLITQMDSTGIRGVTIKGFEINGNHDHNQDKKKGEGYYNMIHFLDSKNIQIHNMYLHDGHGDGLKVERSSNIKFYNNKVYKLGHDGLFAIDCTNVEAWNNRITCRTNGGLRAMNSNHVKFYGNIIDSFYHWSAGGSAILIEKTTGVVNDVEVYNNTISNTYGPGMWLIGYGDSYSKEEAQNVHIHHNTFYNTGTNPSIDWVGGIVTSGFYNTLIENNVFDEIYHAAIINMYPSTTSISDPVDLSPADTGYTTIIRNNIIVNTQKRTKDPDGTGYAVVNYLPKTHIFVLENNCLYNNVGGNYKNANSTTDIYVAPLFADLGSHDYHLKSVAGRWNGTSWVKDSTSSPCIDAGSVSSDYSNEPEDNGNRINIGRYGNTIYASLSG